MLMGHGKDTVRPVLKTELDFTKSGIGKSMNQVSSKQALLKPLPSGVESILIDDVSLVLIPAEDTDRNFIISSWVRSYKSIVMRTMTPKPSDNTYKYSYSRIPEKLWEQALVLKTLESVDSGEPAPVLGYIVGKTVPETLHYVYVTDALRGFGICRLMCQMLFGKGNLVTVTNIWPHKWPYNWRYNPWHID